MLLLEGYSLIKYMWKALIMEGGADKLRLKYTWKYLLTEDCTVDPRLEAGGTFEGTSVGRYSGGDFSGCGCVVTSYPFVVGCLLYLVDSGIMICPYLGGGL